MSVLEGFRIQAKRVAPSNDPQWQNAVAWFVTVTNPRGERFSRKFYMGQALKGAPTLELFMNSIVSEANGVENTGSIEEWAREYGYVLDEPSEARIAKRVYADCVKINDRLKDFLTDEEREAFEDQ